MFEIQIEFNFIFEIESFQGYKMKKYKNPKSGTAQVWFFTQNLPYFLARTLKSLKKYYSGYRITLKIEVFSNEKKINY